MLVVIPICHKDWVLAEKNLQWAKELDGTVQFSALIVHDEKLPVEGLERVKTLAESYFKQVGIFSYPVPTSVEWPEVANHVWQHVAWHIFDKHKDPWFWWEPDATPLKAGWLATLWGEYRKGGRPFGGHVVRGQEHLNGVAIYPANIPEYVSDCFNTRAAPFDVALSKECPTKHIYVMNRWIAHWPRYTEWIQQVKGKALQRLVESEAVLYHGVNDGSLVNSLRRMAAFDAKQVWSEPIEPKDPNPLLVVIEDESIFDEEFNLAEGNYQREASQLVKKGYAMPIKGHHAPSILEQTPFEIGIYPLKPTWDRAYFNPGIVRDNEGREFLVTRRWDRCTPKSWHSTISVYQVNGHDLKHVKDLEFPGQSHLIENEDPRVVFHDGKFFVSHCQWLAESFYQAKQVSSTFDLDWNFIDAYQPNYGFNGFEDYPVEGHQEKNWLWFHDGKDWFFVYSFAPHAVVQPGSMEVHETKAPTHLWPYGEIRGGTPPIRVGDEYITLFHSSLPWSGKQKQYFMGCYAFEAKAPFRVTRITPVAILTGSEEDSRTLGGPLVVFPCGALFEHDEWKVVFGVNDETCAYIKIPHSKLEGLMVKA